MENISKFCTCKDSKCPLNPVNHEKGCSLCVIKCLKDREIPSCFFNLLNKDDKIKGYTFEDFAELVLDKYDK